MRTSFSWFAVLMMALAVTGCPKKDDASKDDDEKSSKSKKKKGDDDDKAGDDDDKGSKKKKKKGDDDDKAGDDDDKGKKKKKKGDDDDDKGSASKKPSSKGPFTANLEGTEIKMTFGKAYPSFSGMHVVLSNEKTKCSFAQPSDEAYQVEFDLPPGPSQKFYAGHPVGVKAYWNSQRIKMKLTYGSSHQVTANVEPFKAKEGEHIKGTLDFDIKYEETKQDTSKKTLAYAGAGSFDVEICDDTFSYMKKLVGLSDDAGEDDVAGEFAGDKFKGKTALATVWHDKANDEDYVQSIEFYTSDDVTCNSRWDAWKKESYFKIDYPGGGSSKQKLTGTPQPIDYATFSKPAPGKTLGNSKSFGGSGGSHGWVQFDKLDFKGGGKITGKLVVESAPDAKPEEAGKMKGKFEAKVCASGF
jgi:hypothetical protein